MFEDKKGKRKGVTVWLKPRQEQMMKEMPDLDVSAIARQAIEDIFEGRNDRDYVRLYMEESLERLKAEWTALGLATAATITATQDGFRVVLVANKDFADSRPEVVVPEEPAAPAVSEDLDEDDFDFEDE